MSVEKSLYATRSMQALELLAFGPGSAPEVAEHLKVDVRTARRLLRRLEADGYIARVWGEGRRRRYGATMRIVALAAQIVEHAALAEVTAPFVKRLHEETGQTAHLSMTSYRSVLCLVHYEAGGPSVVRPRMRELVPAHCTAAGKVLLAHRERWRDSVLGGPLEAHTERTLIDPPALMRDAMQVRARGFAVEDREYQADGRGVAAPVFNHAGEAVAALGISAPAAELAQTEAVLVGARVAEIAAGASAELAHTAAPSLVFAPASRPALHPAAAHEHELPLAAAASRG